MNELGDLRPSQLIFTFGVGALVDLPNMSAMIMGLDDWDTRRCTEINEERLLRALRSRVGAQLERLMLPPAGFEELKKTAGAPPIGVPVAPFPRWLRCPICQTLATIESGIFSLVQDQWRPEKTRYVHTSCGNGPTALPVRFLIACREGHLSDFPWLTYTHHNRVICRPARLRLREYGISGDASDIVVECLECGAKERMARAFDSDDGRFKCPRHHPHLRLIEKEECQEDAKAILLGASNSWFPVVMSSLYIPSKGDRLDAILEQRWAEVKDIPSFEVLKFVARPTEMPWFAEFTLEKLWDAIQKRKAGEAKAVVEEEDLKIAEWAILAKGDERQNVPDFKLRKVEAPSGYEALFESTVVVERLREVRALLGFTRIESNGDFSDPDMGVNARLTPLSREAPRWLPVSEVRGEGIFIQFKEGPLQKWEKSKPVEGLAKEFFEGHKAWRQRRRLTPADAGFPGMRFALLHSLAHAVLRQISLECGYTAASLRERIYCRSKDDKHGPMAGILIYTGASDSEGTLGGLVSMGEPLTLGRHVEHALETMRICASDPLCSEHPVGAEGRGIHAAACHACLFAPETSCERGNRYLDRNILIETFGEKGAAFFREEL